MPLPPQTHPPAPPSLCAPTLFAIGKRCAAAAAACPPLVSSPTVSLPRCAETRPPAAPPAPSPLLRANPMMPPVVQTNTLRSFMGLRSHRPRTEGAADGRTTHPGRPLRRLLLRLDCVRARDRARLTLRDRRSEGTRGADNSIRRRRERRRQGSASAERVTFGTDLEGGCMRDSCTRAALPIGPLPSLRILGDIFFLSFSLSHFNHTCVECFVN